MQTMQLKIRDANSLDMASIFAINRSALNGVSEMDDSYYDLLVAKSAVFRVIEIEEEIVGYICALTREALYDGDEFVWFQNHVQGKFLYIDQVAVSKPFRYQGLGKKLYSDLEKLSSQINITTLVCEVNYYPFNFESQAFHRQLGFTEIDRISTRGMVVSLLVKQLSL